MPCVGRVNRRSRARFRFMAEMRASAPWISCAFAVFDVGKPHAMGIGARDLCKFEIPPTVNGRLFEPVRRFSLGNCLIPRRSAAGGAVPALTVLGPDAMELRFSGPAHRGQETSAKFGGCREEDLSAPPQEPQTHARIS